MQQDLVDDKSLIQDMIWSGNKALTQRMMTLRYDTIWRHKESYESISKIKLLIRDTQTPVHTRR